MAVGASAVTSTLAVNAFDLARSSPLMPHLLTVPTVGGLPNSAVLVQTQDPAMSSLNNTHLRLTSAATMQYGGVFSTVPIVERLGEHHTMHIKMTLDVGDVVLPDTPAEGIGIVLTSVAPSVLALNTTTNTIHLGYYGATALQHSVMIALKVRHGNNGRVVFHYAGGVESKYFNLGPGMFQVGREMVLDIVVEFVNGNTGVQVDGGMQANIAVPWLSHLLPNQPLFVGFVGATGADQYARQRVNAALVSITASTKRQLQQAPPALTAVAESGWSVVDGRTLAACFDGVPSQASPSVNSQRNKGCTGASNFVHAIMRIGDGTKRFLLGRLRVYGYSFDSGQCGYIDLHPLLILPGASALVPGNPRFRFACNTMEWHSFSLPMGSTTADNGGAALDNHVYIAICSCPPNANGGCDTSCGFTVAQAGEIQVTLYEYDEGWSEVGGAAPPLAMPTAPPTTAPPTASPTPPPTPFAPPPQSPSSSGSDGGGTGGSSGGGVGGDGSANAPSSMAVLAPSPASLRPPTPPVPSASSPASPTALGVDTGGVRSGDANFVGDGGSDGGGGGGVAPLVGGVIGALLLLSILAVGAAVAAMMVRRKRQRATTAPAGETRRDCDSEIATATTATATTLPSSLSTDEYASVTLSSLPSAVDGDAANYDTADKLAARR
eukprot:CAMPEP_0198324620 /NCGR_PEP_ID=MMETSP1450-20131203/12591_1 /TAXON_ID=753684 ORGANISM="Madagascaria erythrocladiodes, Strain CCMP3234" /NCGR_SAMPLE_ID=MMETSP1450 /ASSEMBLY_ACC=CAM_ASM_001115 /LENGTH=663 /DNA_ID=CAMNT_0044028431 /DNA_START=12 /DNA_END=1999 /DNA_ORIENTATION=-